MEIVIISLAVVLIIMACIVLKRLNKARKHLRQIESKVDEIYAQMRNGKYTYPKAYPFKTSKF